MDAGELIRRFRVLTRDTDTPPFWATRELLDWLADAEDEACVRARLLLDSTTPSVCRIAVTPGQRVYRLHPRLYELVDVRFRATSDPSHSHWLRPVSREWMRAYLGGRDIADWERERASTAPSHCIADEHSLRIVGPDTMDGVLSIEGYRLPLVRIEDPDQSPEIHEAHHIHLLQWMLHKAFSVIDADAFDPKRSEQALTAFEGYFGLRPDADLRRATRVDVPQANTVHLP